jgi:drug/metabolite transporter (DMT)-like permease
MHPLAPSGSLGLGVAAGLAAAAASAVSYLVSRHHGRSAGASLRLLLLAHVVMGIACLPLIAWLWPARVPPPARWLPSLIGSAACYLGGQAVVFAALRRMPASRLAPLLGLKIVMLAVIVSFLPGTPLDARQWAAVALSVIAAALLRPAGDKGPAAGLTGGIGIVLLGCLSFAVSDLCIVGLIDGLQGDGPLGLGRLHAGGFAMAITYALCGAAAASGLPWAGPRDARDWTAAAQYAAAWLGGMVALYCCFGTVGAVFGNVLQSTRGLMAVAIGPVLAHAGWHDLEERVDRATFARRLAAAALMTAAIAIYAVGPARPPATGSKASTSDS